MTTSSDDRRIADLLLRWEDQQDLGISVSPEELCTDRPDLVSELARRIAALRRIRPVMADDPSGGSPTTEPGPGGGPGAGYRDSAECRARYRDLQFHARGGLGEVFRATGDDLNRDVALKFLKGDRAGDPESRRRFLLEAEVTGRLEHPGVVPVYGLGLDDAGAPCYAMRFVRGETLHDAIAAFHDAEAPGRDPSERALALRGLLRRFVSVCNTIAYAHSRGVLHRDIKPRNVMLGKYDETLVVDWGLAKAFERGEEDREVGEETLTPGSGDDPSASPTVGVVGTPQFMSPEQAEGRGHAVGPAGDVYSLGSTLYVLLTGRSAFPARHVHEVLGKVKRGDFDAPRRVKPDVPRALEAICLKAMAIEPKARYRTALDLAADVERWLADEPVSAYREGAWARLARWTRRHRTLIRAGAAALVVGLVASVALAVQQSRAADRERIIAEREGEALAVAQARLAQVEKANDLLAAVFKDLDPRAEEKEARPLRAILGDRLKVAAAQLEGEVVGDLLTVAKLQNSLGESLANLGFSADAINLFMKAARTREARFGPDHPDTLTSRNNLGSTYPDLGRYAEAVELLEDTLKRRKAKLGLDHSDTLGSRHNLAEAYLAASRANEAAVLHEENLKQVEAKFGPNDSRTLISRGGLAKAYIAGGRRAEAAGLLEANLKLYEAKHGPDHPDTLIERNNLAEAYLTLGRANEAATLHIENLKLYEAKLGPDHPHTLTGRNNLAVTYLAAGRLADAATLHAENLKQIEAKLGPDHPNTLASRSNLATVYESLGRWGEAEALRREVLTRRRRTTPPDNPVVASDLTYLGRNLLKQAKRSEAEVMLREGLAIRVKAVPDDWSRFNTASLLGGVLLALNRYAEAEPLVVQGYEGMKAREAKIPTPSRTRLPEAAERVIRLYEAWGQPAKADEWKRKLGLADLPADVFAGP